MTQLQGLRGRQKPVLDGQVDTVKPGLVLRQSVGWAVGGGGELCRGPGLVEKMPHLRQLQADRSVLDTHQRRGQGGHDAVSLCKVPQ